LIRLPFFSKKEIITLRPFRGRCVRESMIWTRISAGWSDGFASGCDADIIAISTVKIALCGVSQLTRVKRHPIVSSRLVSIITPRRLRCICRTILARAHPPNRSARCAMLIGSKGLVGSKRVAQCPQVGKGPRRWKSGS
jgi:hypothetical protein